VNYADTMTLVKWLTDPAKGQRLIAEFGKDKYGAPLFFANSRGWQAEQKRQK
jgi:tungstate transport system substrate-binding protein